MATTQRPRKARAVAEALRRRPGVVEANVTPGLVRVEFDRTQVDETALRALLDQHGVGVADGSGDESHEHGEGEHVHGGPFGERSELIFAITSGSLWLAGLLLDLFTDVPGGALTAIPAGGTAVGLSNNTSFLRPFTGTGRLTSTATRLHGGRTTQLWDVEHRGEDGKLCATSRVTIALRYPGRSAE